MLAIPVVRTLHVHTFKTDFIHKYLWRCGIDRVIVVSQGIADKLVELGFADQDKISVIPTGVDLNRFRPDIDGSSVRREFDIPESTKVISEIAMIRPDKGQKYFIRAIDRVASAWPDVRFLIVGSATKPEFFEEIKEEIAALRHLDKVILTGFRKDVEKVIAASDVIVNSSPWEPRSQVIHQAFAMKRVVVASDKGGNAESISDGETGFLFCSEDAGSLSDTILLVMNNHTGPIRERAYRAALSDYGIDVMMEKTLSVYRTALTARQSLQG
jgi:glycosyltransferase involved in cell wall biosynthesis